MTWDAWIIFALFWAIFVVTPGPNAVNCITNGMTIGFRRGLIAVAAILTQASAFLTLSAAGITVLITTMPKLFLALQYLGAAFLIYLGIRSWLQAGKQTTLKQSDRGIYLRALYIATINPKSVAGYLAAFSLFVDPTTPMTQQIWVIFPTALCLTALSYVGYTGLGAGLGRAAFGVVMNLWIRRALACCFIIYGILLGGSNVGRVS